MRKLRNKVLVVCNDAGGAEIVSAYVRVHEKIYAFSCFATGPAAAIFKRKKLGRLLITSAKARRMLPSADALLTGTGWSSDVERTFIRAAKESGTRTAAYLDHYVHYRERFGYPTRGWEENLPDELWVGDRHALSLARKSFSGLPVRLVPNLYWRDARERYQKLRKRFRAKPDAVLFMSEPGRGVFDEQALLESVLKAAASSGRRQSVIIAHHPSESRQKYAGLMKRYKTSVDFRSEHDDRLYDFLRAKVVIGMQSMGLVMALLCGKETVSLLPRGMSCSLPQQDIIRIHDAAGLKKLIF